MTAYFITGTGTGVGKTYVTSLLAKSPRILALKPVISGYTESEETDTHILLKAQGLSDPNLISPWRYAASLSPNVAAQREGREIIFSEVVEWCRERISSHQGTVLIEGAGGVMSPLTARQTMLDWVAALKIPAILVAGSYLGTITHTLAAITALKARKIPIQALVISESLESPMPLEEAAQVVEVFSGIKPVIVTRNFSGVPLKF